MNWLVRFMEWVSAGMSGCAEPRWLTLKRHIRDEDDDPDGEQVAPVANTPSSRT